METRASYIIVGIFTLVVFIGGALAVIWMAGVKFDEESAQYDAYFKGSVTGLSPGNQVRYRGVPFGVVTGMRVDPDNVERVKVTIEVPKNRLSRQMRWRHLSIRALPESPMCRYRAARKALKYSRRMRERTGRFYRRKHRSSMS